MKAIVINLAFFAKLANSKKVIWKSAIMIYGSIYLEIHVKAEDVDKD